MIPFKPPEDREPVAGIAGASHGTEGDSEAHSRLIEHVAQAVFETQPSGEVTEVTPSWLAYTGQSLEEALGFGWIDALHPDDRATIVRLRAEATAARRAINGEFRVRRADGSWAWTNVRAMPVLGPDGEIRKWMGMTIDISAQRDAETRLAEALEDYRHAVELNPQMPWTASPGGRVLSCNDHWCRFIGRTRGEALGAAFTSYAHPDDVAAVTAEFLRCMATGDDYDTRLRVLTPDRGERWVRSRARARREGGRIVRWYGFNEDIHDAVLAETSLRAAEERYRLVAQATSDVIWDLDIATDIITWGDSHGTRFGYRLESPRIARSWWLERVHPDDRAQLAASAAAIFSGNGPSEWSTEYRFARADGSYADVVNRGQLVRDAQGRPIRAIGAMIDLTDKRRAEAALLVSEERLRLAVKASGLGISDYDVRSDTLHWSAELRAILGVDMDEPASQPMAMTLIHPDDREEALRQEKQARRGDFTHQYYGVRRIFRKNDGALRWVATRGHPVHNDAGTLIRVVVTAKDVTDEKTAQDRLRWTATHDAVTGLLNRAAFQAALDSAMEAAGPERPLALLLIDLDNFKQINDSHGHHAGDLVLRTFGDRIGVALPTGGVLARFGGDEFALVLPGMALEAAAALADDLQTIFRRPFALDGGSVDLRASLGIAMFPDHAANAEDLVKCADIALYAAKDSGRSMVRVFEPAMRSTLQEHATMLHQARSVVDNAWAQPFYQPKIAFGSGRVTGLEALFRWRHPQSGLQSPATIAHAFDDFELAAVLGETMVEAVLADVRKWRDAGVEIGRVAINASAAEFRNPSYAERLLGRLDAHGVPASALELEITETAFLGDSEGHVLHALETLRAAGMTVALDDFGTGFSSLAHLRHFPVDTLKIDQSFVSGIDERAGDRAIIEVVLRLGEALGLTTVAEGVETQSQAAFLRGRGCKLAQGYLFARPMPAARIAPFVASRGTERRAG